MVTQSSLWQSEQQSSDFAELCNALYERELRILATTEVTNVTGLQGRIKSLPYYVKRSAHALLNADSPLALDIQNASWSAKQATALPFTSQLQHYSVNVLSWYQNNKLAHGLVVPIATQTRVILDCIDRVDEQNQRFRTNAHGWFNLHEKELSHKNYQLLKPTKKIMTAACAGHCWRNSRKVQPIIPSLRELLLSCAINWRNFKQPFARNN